MLEFSTSDAVQFERRLRRGMPPVIARLERGRIVLDMRTVADEEEHELAAAVLAAA